LAFKKTFGQSFDTIEPLNAGSSISFSVLYKAYLNKKPYVIRFGNVKLKDSRREIKTMMIASNAGITPKIYYANNKDGLIIMDYIESKGFSENENSNPKIYEKLGWLAKQIHSLDKFPKFMTVFEIIRYNKYQLTASLSKLIKGGESKLKTIEKTLKKYSIHRSIHNDLNPNNILYDGKDFWVIDWEMASQGDPFFDLATLANFYIFDNRFEKIFLRAYFGREPNEAERARFYLMKQVSLYYYGLELIYGSQNLGAKSKSFQEIQLLPSLAQYYKNSSQNEKTLTKAEHLSKFGHVLLKEALINLNSKTFQKTIDFRF